jgi:hypothetical protein
MVQVHSTPDLEDQNDQRTSNQWKTLHGIICDNNWTIFHGQLDILWLPKRGGSIAKLGPVVVNLVVNGCYKCYVFLLGIRTQRIHCSPTTWYANLKGPQHIKLDL